MQRPRKLHAPMTGYMPPIHDTKQRIPVTCEPASIAGHSGAGALEIRHPSGNYTFVNHNARDSSSRRSNAGAAAAILSAENISSTSSPNVLTTPPPFSSGAHNRSGGSILTFGSHQASSHFSLGVEGVRTGEEVLVESAAPRQRNEPQLPDQRKSSSSITSFAESDEVKQLRRRLAVSRAECKTLTERLQKRKADVQRARALEILATEEAEQRRVVQGECWEKREAVALSFATRALVLHRNALDKQADEARRRGEEMQRQMAAEAASLQKEKEALHRRSVAAEAEERKKESSALAALQQQLAEAKKRLEEQSLFHAREAQRMEADRIELQHTLLRTSTELREKIQRIAQDEFLIAQCRLFVKNICHPGFSVVKDASLEPVDRNRAEPSGFVLVPLTVLLHGYTLLPEKERRDVIDSYEKKMATM